MSRSIVIYVAGPYRAELWGDVKRNVSRAMDVAAEILRMGFSMICPHSMTHEFEMYGLPDNAFLESDLVLIERCDILLALDGWGQSKGTLAEIEHAERLGIPVIHQQYGAWRDRLPDVAESILNDREPVA